jgi:hypothetical protein
VPGRPCPAGPGSPSRRPPLSPSASDAGPPCAGSCCRGDVHAGRRIGGPRCSGQSASRARSRSGVTQETSGGRGRLGAVAQTPGLPGREHRLHEYPRSTSRESPIFADRFCVVRCKAVWSGPMSSVMASARPPMLADLQGSPFRDPFGRLSGDGGDPVVVGVVVQDRRAGLFSGRRDDQVRQPEVAVLASAG